MGKITFTLSGQKLKGRFTLVRTHLGKRERREEEHDQWLFIKSTDEFESKEDLTITRPESVLSGKVNEDLEDIEKVEAEGDHNKNYERRSSSALTKAIKINNNKKTKDDDIRKEREDIEKVEGKDNDNTTTFTNKQQQAQQQEQEFPTKIKPMLSTLVDDPFNNKDWVFEVKWDGVRSILLFHKAKGILGLQSRNGKLITHRYPELLRALNSPSTSSSLSSKLSIKCKESAILDGEIVVLDRKTGIPSFQNHQRRMNVDYIRDIKNLSEKIPATYYLFDILYLDGRNLQSLPFLERRRILREVIAQENARIKISHFIEEVGKEVFDKTKDIGLEGVVAKHKSSIYVQGVHSRDWLKIKNIKTQDCVVIGYTRGEGNRQGYFGSLLLAVYDSESNKFRFVGHTGSGFDFGQLDEIYDKLQKMKIEKCPIDYVPYTNREPVWVRPDLVAEVKFSDWTSEKIMRAPIFLRFREDKAPRDCIMEGEKPIDKVLEEAAVGVEEPELKKSNGYYNNKKSSINNSNAYSHSSSSSSFCFSNLDKVFWDKSREHPVLTKKDLIEYYNKISNYILPYLKDRPLSLSRFPDGIKGKSFYHKNWNQQDNNKPTFVQTAKIYSESREGNIINYIICNNKETLLWLTNLGCIEMHPWYSRIKDFDLCKEKDDVLYEERCGLNFPDFIVFDLDPYIYEEENEGQKEPEYNLKAFRATVDVAYNLKDLFDDLKIESYVKTSGKTGLHIFVPIANMYTYEQTRAFAEVICKILKRKYPQKITMEWDTAKRKGKVFFDHNQNARGKTIASTFSARPTHSATVSMPLKWKDLSSILPTDFTILTVPDIVNRSINPWDNILEKKQDLSKILEAISERFS
jgi:bifunctional non-homologous end joining protein LigD